MKLILEKYRFIAYQSICLQCVDIDQTVALMCYVQLSLWNVPGQVIVGNTLTLEYREQFFTPAHRLFNWDYKLATEDAQNLIAEQSSVDNLPTVDPCALPERTIKPGHFEQFSLF